MKFLNKKEFWYKIGMVLFSFLLLAVLELLLRLVGVGNSYKLFIKNPENDLFLNVNPVISEKYFVASQEMNTGGYLEPFLKSKPDTCIRIFVMGGSTAAGFPYDESAATFPKLLHYSLEQTYPDRHIEIINTSLTAVNTVTLLDFAGDIIKQDPDAILIYAGHNEYYGVLGAASTHKLGSNKTWINTYLFLSQLRIWQLMEKAYHATAGARPKEAPNASLMETLAKNQLVPYQSEVYVRGVMQFKNNMNALLQKFSKQGIPVFIGTLVSNEKHQRPFISEISKDSTTFSKYYTKGASLLKEGNFDSSLENLRKALEIDSLHADAHFMAGINYFNQDKFTVARNHFIKAKDCDLLRFRAPEEFNRLIYQMADDKNVRVVPVQKMFIDHSGHGIIGNELITEHLHPNIEGYRLMAEAFGKALNSYFFDEQKDLIISKGAVTQFDSLYAEIGLTYLRSQWPFSNSGKEINPITRFNNLSIEFRYAAKVFKNEIPRLEAELVLFRHYMKAENFTDALKMTQSLRLRYPQKSYFHELTGEVYFQMGNPEKALKYYKDALMIYKYAENYSTERFNQIAQKAGMAAIQVNQIKYAKKCFMGIISRDKKNPVAPGFLVMINKIQSLENQLKNEPDNPVIMVDLASSYLTMRNYKSAQFYVELALKQNNNYAEAIDLKRKLESNNDTATKKP